MADERSPDPGSEGQEERGGETAETDANDSDGEKSRERRPISVRDLMPPAPAGGRRPTEERGNEGGADEEILPPRPTPVRVAMDTPPPGDSRPAEELPSVRFEAGDEEWVARVTGRTLTGSPPDPGALLMHLSFYRAEDPDRPVRELLTVHRPLEALYDEDLRELLERSRPAREPFAAESEPG